ncbi:MAG TPA: Glu/Leu/Phe/Val dehydrogenase dimerization domain-containing protein [Candidatus Ozemobacteraceae bacterium]|nr:Glu/Leu/Phe/Val dehydrogenase dimerization domain-containing protein [Candidatus Ozemobacteraceae bacterium]
MNTFDIMQHGGLEQIVYFHDESVALKAVVAIHSTQLGPAIGGVRMMEYASQSEVVKEAVDLAQEMTFRAALADCDLGGGAVVLWGNPKTKSEALFRSLGRFIRRLGGQFLAVMEVGTDSRDLRNIRRETDFVYSLPEAYGGIADPTETTAEGVLYGLKATAKTLFNQQSLAGMTFVVQGVGRLGSAVVKRLVAAKAKLVITDRNYDKIKNIQDVFPEITMIRPEEVLGTKCDMLVPCALGNLIDAGSIDRLRCKAVAGGASNIIPDLATGDELHKRGITYVPHFVMDAGKLIQADHELKKLSKPLLDSAVGEIYTRTVHLLETAREAKEAPVRTAVKLAWNRLSAIGQIGQRKLKVEAGV